MQPLAGALVLTGDFLEPETAERVRQALAGPADVVLSDMAGSATGHAATDHLRSMALAEAAFDFAVQVLVPGGAFVAKVLQGPDEQAPTAALRRRFAKLARVTPSASRHDTREFSLVATGFTPP